MKRTPLPVALRPWLKRAGWFLLLVGVLVLVLDRVIMPAYTRQGDVALLPRVVGLPIDEARAILDSLDFPVSVERREVDSGPRARADEVLEQFPRGNLLTKRGRTVHLTLSSGKTAFEMPDLRRKTERQALVLLADLGLEMDSTALRWRFDPEPAGTVLRQEPGAGRKTQRGSKVGLVYSLGPRPESVDVPGLLGLDLPAARLKLERVGLVLGTIEEEAEQGRPAGIRGQQPLAGSRLVPGDSVSVRFNRPDGPGKETPDTARIEEEED